MKRALKVLAIVMAVMVMGATQISAEGFFEDCGIGAIFFNGEKKGDKQFAKLLNLHSTGTSSYATSSKLSGTCAGKENQLAAALFIYETYPTLIEDTAKGSGEHLTTVLNLLDAPESRDAIISTVQTQLLDSINASEYSSQSRLEVSEKLFTIVNNAI
jgi:hypothetical protein